MRTRIYNTKVQAKLIRLSEETGLSIAQIIEDILEREL